MTTRRKRTRATERLGVDYVMSIVHQANCTFTETGSEDMGTDAYIEFVQQEAATGCCIAVQIKTGESFVSRSGDKYYLPADKDHLEYWAAHALPVAGIVYDPQTNKAAWCDIKEYLCAHPQVITTGPFRIPIQVDREFTAASFQSFFDHFAKQADTYRSDSSFGRALTLFARQDDPHACLDGIISIGRG